jgi:hypothetical protein
MDDSEKALALAYISHQKFERYARTIAEQLEQNDFVIGKESYWRRLKTELRTNPSAPDTGVDYFAGRCCSELLRGLFPEELRLLWLGTDAADKAGPHAFFRPRYASDLAGELYRRVKYLALEEARKEAEREAWFATTPKDVKRPVSVTSDEIVIPLADFLVTFDDLVSDVNRNLDNRMVVQSLPKTDDHEEMEKALRVLLDNNSDFILPEDLEDAMGLQRDERGECLFDRLITNTSTGWRDQDMFYWSR